jgi:hypothetical protein
MVPRPRAKLSDSAPKIKSDEKRDERKETNDTLVIQYPNEISHDVILGCWDSFGTLFLMGALVLIGKLIRLLNGSAELVAGFLSEELWDCWAEKQDKEERVRQKKRRETDKRKDSFDTYLKKPSCEVCLRKDYLLSQHPFNSREVLRREASLFETPDTNKIVSPIRKGERLTCAIEDQYRQNRLSQRIRTPFTSRPTTEEERFKTDPYSEYDFDPEDFDMEGPSFIPTATSIIRLPMPLPGSPGVPLFEGANATEFLDNFDDLCDEYAVAEQGKLVKLPKYCSRSIGDSIKSQKAWVNKDYQAL